MHCYLLQLYHVKMLTTHINRSKNSFLQSIANTFYSCLDSFRIEGCFMHKVSQIFHMGMQTAPFPFPAKCLVLFKTAARWQAARHLFLWLETLLYLSSCSVVQLWLEPSCAVLWRAQYKPLYGSFTFFWQFTPCGVACILRILWWALWWEMIVAKFIAYLISRTIFSCANIIGQCFSNDQSAF